MPELCENPLFAKNADRVRNRSALIPILRQLTFKRSMSEWLAILEAAGVPAGPINTLDCVFKSKQVAARDMKIRLAHTVSGTGFVNLIGNPLKFSETPVHYAKPPPRLGEDTDQILKTVCNMTDEDIAVLRAEGILGI
jgi:crotonobetainyl-CoA:carnitine CoA-transferase CaiB-like acyl-CoA transferase